MSRNMLKFCVGMDLSFIKSALCHAGFFSTFLTPNFKIIGGSILQHKARFSDDMKSLASIIFIGMTLIYTK